LILTDATGDLQFLS